MTKNHYYFLTGQYFYHSKLSHSPKNVEV